MTIFGRCMIVALFGLLGMQAHAQYYADPGAVFVCKSSGYQQNYCGADTRGGVRMTRQISSAACIQGRTWGFDRRGVWVTQGCEAEFVLGARDSAQMVRCASSDYRQNYCGADTRGGVSLARQVSSAACVQGRTWGYDRRGIWVSNGCEADFVLGGGYGPGPRPGPGPGYVDARVVRCESSNSRTVRCNLDTRGGVQLAKQLSSSGCYQGRTWGWDRDGIWVSNGCRADFQVGGFAR